MLLFTSYFVRASTFSLFRLSYRSFHHLLIYLPICLLANDGSEIIQKVLPSIHYLCRMCDILNNWITLVIRSDMLLSKKQPFLYQISSLGNISSFTIQVFLKDKIFEGVTFDHMCEGSPERDRCKRWWLTFRQH